MRKRRSRGGRPAGSYRSVAPRGIDIGPTSELLEKRAILRGDADIGREGRRIPGAPVDDPRAGYPLGVLYARQLISEIEHDAGLWYGWLHRRRFGAPLANAAPFYERMVTPLPRNHTAPIPDEDQERLEDLYRRVDRALLADAGPLPKRAVQEVAVFETFPHYIEQSPDRWRPPHPFFDLKTGLRALRHIRLRDGGRKA